MQTFCLKSKYFGFWTYKTVVCSFLRSNHCFFYKCETFDTNAWNVSNSTMYLDKIVRISHSHVIPCRYRHIESNNIMMCIVRVFKTGAMIFHGSQHMRHPRDPVQLQKDTESNWFCCNNKFCETMDTHDAFAQVRSERRVGVLNTLLGWIQIQPFLFCQILIVWGH